MNGNDFRRAFVTRTLSEAIAADPTDFYGAFEDGEDAVNDYITGLWETQCASCGVTLAEHPCFPETVAYILEDTEDGFCAIVTVSLPQTPSASACKAAVVFGSAMDPRVFAAVPVLLDKGETLAVIECREPTVEVATLHQGCDNNLQLFDPPTPQKRDKTVPLAAARREAAFVDTVVCWCLKHD